MGWEDFLVNLVSESASKMIDIDQKAIDRANEGVSNISDSNKRASAQASMKEKQHQLNDTIGAVREGVLGMESKLNVDRDPGTPDEIKKTKTSIDEKYARRKK
jgi:hypothetical protein